MRNVSWLVVFGAALALAGCATAGYDGCHGVGCQVDNPDQPKAQ